ncbi:MAG: Ppx/GppA family phosphatase [Geopsychrobacter sp.]|nr:Ppx/GppA family phosphatase [Geopsychrobacter sp.]
MIRAAIDVGSNTVRMLVAEGELEPLLNPVYFRQVTRLGGGFDPQTGLAAPSMDRTLAALGEFTTQLKTHHVNRVRAIGTAALRRAANADTFLAKVKHQTGIVIDIISGETEAALSCRGILSVLRPVPECALLFDIGGGSTEIILLENSHIQYQQSLALGVVSLLEDYPDFDRRSQHIEKILSSVRNNPTWQRWMEEGQPVGLVGTAGTLTTLAALKLAMTQYDASRVNNLILQRDWLNELAVFLLPLSLPQRAALPGMEKGRADLILPGLQIVESLMACAQADELRVSDAGLLEGLLLCPTEEHFHLTNF